MLQMLICIVIITFAIAITIAFGHIDIVTSAPLDTSQLNGPPWQNKLLPQFTLLTQFFHHTSSSHFIYPRIL